MNDTIRLKIELQARGLRVPGGLQARSGGAGPADGVTLFMDDVTASVPTDSLYVRSSPYALERRVNDEWLVTRGSSPVREVRLAGAPRFYDGTTPDGLLFRKLALRHGRDAVGSTVVQGCVHGRDACLFCAISTSARDGKTTTLKSPEELALVAAAAHEEGYSHFILTTGTANLEDMGILRLSECARAIRAASDIRVHVQFEPPLDLELIDLIAGASDSAAINIESFDMKVLEWAAPGKSRVGLERYAEAWRRAVDAFGAGQVTSFIIVGLGETRRSILDGTAMLASIGVYPLLVPLRPLRGTPLEAWSPPAVESITPVYEEAAGLVSGHGLRASACLAGCVRCGACSAFPDITG
jgi:radical SAM protein (TIGR04043 family)